MKKRTIASLILSLLVMVLVPILTVQTVLSPDALGLMFIYTMVLNPIVSVVIGILSVSDGKVQWHLPVVNAVIYLIAAIAVMGFDVSLLLGAAVYLVLGVAAAYIAKAVSARKAGK